ncbi:MAG: hypothetical protein ACXWCG_04785 [Flavitalea sp.]
MSKAKPTTVTEYINAAPREAQKKLREIRSIYGETRLETRLERKKQYLQKSMRMEASFDFVPTI